MTTRELVNQLLTKMAEDPTIADLPIVVSHTHGVSEIDALYAKIACVGFHTFNSKRPLNEEGLCDVECLELTSASGWS